jgi:hypothetical protein
MILICFSQLVLGNCVLEEHYDVTIKTALQSFKTNEVYNYGIVFLNAKCNLLWQEEFFCR